VSWPPCDPYVVAAYAALMGARTPTAGAMVEQLRAARVVSDRPSVRARATELGLPLAPSERPPPPPPNPPEEP
jgi:hypothetical protein